MERNDQSPLPVDFTVPDTPAALDGLLERIPTGVTPVDVRRIIAETLASLPAQTPPTRPGPSPAPAADTRQRRLPAWPPTWTKPAALGTAALGGLYGGTAAVSAATGLGMAPSFGLLVGIPAAGVAWWKGRGWGSGGGADGQQAPACTTTVTTTTTVTHQH